MRIGLLGLLLSFFCLSAISSGVPLGDPKAPKGGQFVIGYPSYPKDLLFYLAFDEQSEGINALITESLLETDLNTYEFVPLLASEWKVSDDKLTFTFKLNPKAKFSDGKPVTSKDVKFTWDTIMNPKNKTAPIQAVYSSFESCTAIDPQTVQFKAKTPHFKNLEKLAGLIVLPEHFFSKGDFNRAFHTSILGSGPYTLETLKQGERIVVKRDPNYWGASLPQNIGRYNFDRVVFKVVPDMNVSFELFKKGEIDYFYFLSAKMWTMETKAPPFEKNYIKKIKAENVVDYMTQGLVWNLRRPLFKDVKVRTALAHLMNREDWITKLFYGNYILAAGIAGTKTPYHSPKNKPIAYDPKKARQLLKEAGWTKVGGNGILVKDGQRFEFDILTDNPMSERYWTLYQEDLKKVGIKANIRVVDWATSIKLSDDWAFDAKEQARGREVDPGDFAVVWGSKEADIKGSANTSGYKNPEVDALAKQIDETFDKKKRIKMVQKIDEIIGRDQPMAFAWEASYFRLGHWNRYSYPGKGYFNYSTWRTAYQYWWLDPAKQAKLEKAMKEGKPVVD